jgi:hypothetical protein
LLHVMYYFRLLAVSHPSAEATTSVCRGSSIICTMVEGS